MAYAPSLVSKFGFDESETPATTAGAYAANDIVGGLLTFENIAPVQGGMIELDYVQIDYKSDVAAAPILVLFDADPTATTKTDNAPYALNSADLFKVKASLVFSAMGVLSQDHGSVRTYFLRDINIPLQLADGSTTLYGLLVDATGFTLGSIADIKVTIRGGGI